MILVSAGHHATAQGAQYAGHTEWKEAVLWRSLIVNEIGQHQAHEVPSGTLPQKVSYINQREPWMAVEVHFNSAVNALGAHVGKGSETLYYPGSVKGRIIAKTVQEHLRQAMENTDRGVKEGWYRMDAPGRVDFHGDVDGDEKIDYFLRETRCPAVIIEPEFIQHQLRITDRRLPGSKAIARALLEAAAKLDLL